MNDASAKNALTRKRASVCIGLRLYGALAIAFGVFQASLLVVKFPPSPRFAGGMYIGILIGILGIPVFLLVRWAVVIFILICVTFGGIVVYACITSQPIEWAFGIWAAFLLVVAPIGLLWSSWSSLR